MLYSKTYGKVSLMARFEFVSLVESSLNQSRALFAVNDCAKEFPKKLKRRLEDKLEYGNPVHCPEIQIQVRREANDTQIMDFESDWNKLEISFDWKTLYHYT